MPNELSKPKTEAEEARWFDDNQDHLMKLFEQAQHEGALRVGKTTVGISLSKQTESLRKPSSQKVMPRIPADDLDRARD